MGLSKTSIKKRDITVGIVGLGYVGLPLALAFSEANFKVIGFDVNKKKVSSLKKGDSILQHLAARRIQKALKTKRFFPTHDFSKITECQAVIICVPTPLKGRHQPDLTFVTEATRAVAKHITPGTLVSLESTTWPGTTDEVVVPLLEKGGKLTLGKDLFVCYSPEREDPGNKQFDLVEIPKLISGASPCSLEKGELLYGSVFNKVIPVESPRIAEAAKLFENIFRFVNIGLVNELKMICDKMDLDPWQVIEAAATKPFGFMPFWPSAGVGGHCLPLDPYYLKHKAKQSGAKCEFIDLAGKVNSHMPQFVAKKVKKVLKQEGKTIQNARILVLGVAYKCNTDDIRESPTLELMEELEAMGARVDFYDPHIPAIEPLKSHPQFSGKKRKPLSNRYDCFVLATPHSTFSCSELLRYKLPIIDACHYLPQNPLVYSA